MPRRFDFCPLMSCIAISWMAASCVSDEVYHKSAVVSTKAWTAADTLSFPLCVADSSESEGAIRTQTPYEVHLSVRHSSATRHDELRMFLCAERMDSLGRPDSTLWRRRVTAPLLDGSGAWAGGTWGSLVQRDYVVTPSQLVFPAEGDYRMVLVPEAVGGEPYGGIESVGLSLRR